MITCIIVDDEPHATDLLELLIKQQTDWHLSAICDNATEALSYIQSGKPDLLFLDINMPNLNGLELAELLPDTINIVFTTAYSEFAAESYSFNTIDYLLKPITLKRFLKAKAKIEKVLFTGAQTNPEIKNLFIKSGKTLRQVAINDIYYFQGEKEYVRVVAAGVELMIYRRLKDVEDQLKGPFIRVHNSYIINAAFIKKIEDNHVFIADKKIPISDKFREDFMALVKERTF